MNLIYVTSILFLFCVPALPAQTLYRVVYDDDPLLKLDRTLLEEAYGAKIVVIPAEQTPNGPPLVLDGIVVHVDPPYDSQWVVGTRNPSLDFLKLKEEISSDFKGVKNIEHKWDEYLFLKQIAPEMAPPEMHQGSEFSGMEIPESEREEIRKLVVSDDPLLIEHCIKLEIIRRRMHALLGKSIVKIGDTNHSEGKLPKTDKNWIEIFIQYWTQTRPAVERIKQEIEGTSTSLQDLIVKLPYIEGRVLETLLVEPQRVIVQKMIPIQDEARIHWIEGAPIAATFPRFYNIGEYLSRAEKLKIHRAIAKWFRKQLTGNWEKYRRLSFTADIVIEEGTGRLYILDWNAGLDSGYYFPEEDLFTTNLLAERLSGHRTPFLLEFDGFTRLPMGENKVTILKRMLDKYSPFMQGDVLEAFWDRVIEHYQTRLALRPNSKTYNTILHALKDSGLDTASIFFQFIAETQDTYPELKLSEEHLQFWKRYLTENDPNIETTDREGRLFSRDIEEERKEAANGACAQLGKLT